MTIGAIVSTGWMITHPGHTHKEPCENSTVYAFILKQIRGNSRRALYDLFSGWFLPPLLILYADCQPWKSSIQRSLLFCFECCNDGSSAVISILSALVSQSSPRLLPSPTSPTVASSASLLKSCCGSRGSRKNALGAYSSTLMPSWVHVWSPVFYRSGGRRIRT